MKNLIGAVPMVTMAQSAVNWRNTQLPPRCMKHQLSYYRIWNHIFILKVPEGGGLFVSLLNV